jgi:nucleoside-diphosphate-sugar epimerase
MQPPSTVLVLGARGRFGSAAVDAFAAAGWQVLAQCRPGRAGAARPGVHWLPLPAGDTGALAAAATGADVVVHGLSPAYTHRAWRTGVPRLTQAAIDLARALQATLMLPASVYNFGDGMPARLLEGTPQAPTTFKGRMRIASEAMVRAATQDGGLRAVVIRAGDFFGSGSGAWFDRVMASGLPGGRFTYPGTMDVPTAWAFLPDLAQAFVQVARVREALEPWEVLHFAGHTCTGADWAEALQREAHARGWLAPQARLRTRTLPWPLLRVAALAIPTLAALCEMRYLWRTPHALVNTRMAALAGPEPHTPFQVAVSRALDDLALAAPARLAAA